MDDEDQIVCLDDFDTETIKLDGWELDRLFSSEVENMMPNYEKAMVYAEDLITRHKVAVRTFAYKDAVFLEVYKKD